jgi:phage baseplate assembly protein W
MISSSPSPKPIGWPLLPLPDASGQLHFPSLEASVRQYIQILLRTRPGEQLMRKDFGAGLEAFLHEPNTLATRSRIRELIIETIEERETRVLLDRVDVSEVDDAPAQIRIEIVYRLKRTGAPQQMGITMELEA